MTKFFLVICVILLGGCYLVNGTVNEGEILSIVCFSLFTCGYQSAIAKMYKVGFKKLNIGGAVFCAMGIIVSAYGLYFFGNP